MSDTLLSTSYISIHLVLITTLHCSCCVIIIPISYVDRLRYGTVNLYKDPQPMSPGSGICTSALNRDTRAPYCLSKRVREVSQMRV